MKTTDIEIGQEYAVKNPNDPYASTVRVTATRKGVYGNAPKSNRWSGKSAHPNFIEFDLIEGCAFDYKVTLGGDGLPTVRGYDSRDQVFRAAPSHFICTWHDHVAEKAREAAHERSQAEWEEKREAEVQAALEGLKDLGVKSAYLYDGRICLPVEAVEEILSSVRNS